MTTAVAADFSEANVRELWSPVARHYARKYVGAAKDLIEIYDKRKAVAPAEKIDFAPLEALTKSFSDAAWDVSKAAAERNRDVYSLGRGHNEKSSLEHHENIQAKIDKEVGTLSSIDEFMATLPPRPFQYSSELLGNVHHYLHVKECFLWAARWSVAADSGCALDLNRKVGAHIAEKCPDLIEEMNVGHQATTLWLNMIGGMAGNNIAQFKLERPRIGFTVNG